MKFPHLSSWVEQRFLQVMEEWLYLLLANNHASERLEPFFKVMRLSLLLSNINWKHLQPILENLDFIQP